MELKYMCSVSKKPLHPLEDIVFKKIRWHGASSIGGNYVPVCECHNKMVLDLGVLAYNWEYMQAVREAGYMYDETEEVKEFSADPN